MTKPKLQPDQQTGTTAPAAESAPVGAQGTPDATPAPEPAAPQPEPVEPVEAVEPVPAEPTDGTPPATTPLVVCAYPGTEQVVEEVWRRNCDTPIQLMPIDTGTDIREILEECIADDRIADDFVLVPANTIPCSKVMLEELRVPLVYIDGQQREQHNHRLPMPFRKESLVEFLAVDGSSGEAFAKGYAERYRTRPVQVSYVFGNYVTPVLRPNPCENVVLEAFVKRKFVTANPAGFAAIESIIRSALLK